MADQVAGLEARGISSCAAVNGLLSMPERADVLDRVRLGDVGILIVSPEQLRNRTLRKVLAQREIGAWVLDEAHCISKWGHDFRPDYRYVARFIKEKAGDGAVPPILCLTATAKPDVVMDILGHFRDKLGVELSALRRRRQSHQSGFRRGAHHDGRRNSRMMHQSADGGSAAGLTGRRHRLLCFAPANRGDRGLSA